MEKVRLFQDTYAAGLTSRNIAELRPCIGTVHSAQYRRITENARRRAGSNSAALRSPHGGSGPLGRLNQVHLGHS